MYTCNIKMTRHVCYIHMYDINTCVHNRNMCRMYRRVSFTPCAITFPVIYFHFFFACERLCVARVSVKKSNQFLMSHIATMYVYIYIYYMNMTCLLCTYI